MSGIKVYKASAGSGKTYTLALEYIRELLIKKYPNAHRNILAVTFTKDATGEMKDRILAELYGLAFNCEDSKGFLHSLQDALKDCGKPMKEEDIQSKAFKILQEILHDYSRLHITTIDSFFQQVLRNLARELGKGSRFNLEMNSTKVLSEAVSSMIENANENPQLLEWLTTYIEEKLDEGSNWRIEKEILNFSKCIFNEYFQEHEHILKKQLDSNPKIFEELWNRHSRIQKESKEFFKKAYATVSAKMSESELELSDFNRNGVVINLFKKLSDEDFSTANPNSKTVQDCIPDPTKWASSKTKRAFEVADLAETQFMPLLHSCLETLQDYNTSRMITNNIYQLGLIWDITNEISRQNTENNRFMLADTALFLNQMIDHSDTSFIYEKISAEIRHVMIDEFQDTSRIQWQNFKSLLSGIISEDAFSMIVGDVKQSIYRWRNGDWRILGNIDQELHVNPLSLSFNYRSEQNIISFNNELFANTAKLLDEKYHSIFGATSVSPFRNAYSPENVTQKTPKKEENGYVSIRFVADKTENGKYNDLVLEEILQQLQQLYAAGISAENICILTRTNKSITAIAEYFSIQKKLHPELAEKHYLNIVSNEAFQLNSSSSVRIIIEALKVLSDPENPVHKAQLQIFSDKFVRNIHTGLHLLLEKQTEIPDILKNHKQLTGMPLFELIGHLFRLFELEKIEGQSGYMYAFYDAVSNYLKDYPADIHTFLKYWTDELQFKTVPSSTGIEGIRAMTIHKSKGLQFHTVLIPYCDWDLYPEKNPVVWCGPKNGLYDLELLPVKYTHKMFDTVFLNEYEQETGQSWMDNLNLLYVAFTRAERNLLITGKYKKKLADTEDIKNVSDLLQFSVSGLDGNWDEENLYFEKGVLFKEIISGSKESDNLLKNTPSSIDVSFVSKAFNPEKSIFRQSNKSREFTKGEEFSGNEYIIHGNIMHALFSGIQTLTDIPSAVDRLCFHGLIRPEEKTHYEEEIIQAINEAGVEDWFSEKYKIYNECAILVEENGSVTTKRPDRILTNTFQTIIIDYKFGEPHPSHQKQMQQYIQLMQQMEHSNIQAFLWYVKKNQKISVPLQA